MSTAVFIICMVVGNFFYQSIQSTPDWEVATERSYFQAIAVLLYVLLQGNS